MGYFCNPFAVKNSQKPPNLVALVIIEEQKEKGPVGWGGVGWGGVGWGGVGRWGNWTNRAEKMFGFDNIVLNK